LKSLRGFSISQAGIGNSNSDLYESFLALTLTRLRLWESARFEQRQRASYALVNKPAKEESMHDIFLETERLTLRRFTEADAENLYELDNDPDVMRFINGGSPTPRNVIKNMLLPGFLRYDLQYPGYGFWAVVEKTTGKFLGWLSFRPTGSNPAEVTLGFRLRKAAWGKGYAAEGARALIRKGFTEMGDQRVLATTYEDNLSSQSVIEKTGLTWVRKFRLTLEDLEKADTFHVDANEIWAGYDFEYALEKSEWERTSTFLRASLSQETD
jgi:RimJ/RimL family protein N-acetyltransferase